MLAEISMLRSEAAGGCVHIEGTNHPIVLA